MLVIVPAETRWPRSCDRHVSQRLAVVRPRGRERPEGEHDEGVRRRSDRSDRQAAGAAAGRRAGTRSTALTRSAEKAEALRAAGAEPVVADALDRAAVTAAVRGAAPEVVVHELTAIDRTSATCATSTAASPPPTGCAPRAPTTCSRPRARPARAASSPRASPAGRTRARAARSRPRTTRSTRPAGRRCARRSPRSATSSRR